MTSLFLAGTLTAQPVPPRPASDALRVVEILGAERYGYKRLDSLNELLLLVGSVRIRQESTVFEADSAVYNRQGRTVEAFGNVHINDRDSIHTYSDYLHYRTDTRVASLKKGVRLTDGVSDLYTQDLEYDVNARTGIYRNGGRVVNGSTTLTSDRAVYYADPKDVHFAGGVTLRDPQYDLQSDSLLYNTETEITSFLTHTVIRDSAGRTIQTSDGYYDLHSKKAFFGKRPVIRDGAVTVIANEVDANDSTGISVLTGNAVFRDTAEGVSILANAIVTNRNAGTMLATREPLMILEQEGDSIFIAADTLYSGTLQQLAAEQARRDSLARAAADSVGEATDVIPPDPAAPDSSSISPDGLSAPTGSERSAPDLPDSVAAGNTEVLRDTVAADSTLRFIRAYRNVRIFSDSLQAVCDSLFYSAADSTFRLFRDPVLWAGESQVTGDTILLQTRNRKPHELHVFESGMMVSRVSADMFNQVKGTRLFGYFADGEISSILARGNAESIYYATDEEQRLIGINKASSEMIEMRFRSRELQEVVFKGSVSGSMIPFREAREEDRRLRNFRWQDKRRPKSRQELFGQ